ncbi:protein of unknown function [Saccharopolyspora antimicrobica]|uniref:Uncharacterized protein DUF397 n=1 Tax=Saccharopolyspora antimicrobica TaxID=455193 RepID=A0A1I5J6R9_9PSEU|nr:DUF397 domain-containing protein [Saccharopolyspora antimicrobica]RKT82064.1 uncharacterized protein DUF397 [Saccharopolyspora antimicrobica]SFO68574.1 protein of unknown function [Saccharopolyspora antimicrobica]
MNESPTGWRKSSYSAQQVTCVEVGRIEGDWRKSSRSHQISACVEVAPTSYGAAVRDSKDRDAGYFTTTADQWRLFVTAVKAGRFEV